MDPKDKKTLPAHPPVIENLHAPEMFAHAIPNFSIGNGVVTLTLTSTRWDITSIPARQSVVVVGRLTVPVGTARLLATSLHDFLEQQGVPAVSDDDKKHMQ